MYAEGWILLHNPQRGIAEVEQNEGKNMTKAQRETLYDYYIFFNRIEEANDLYKE